MSYLEFFSWRIHYLLEPFGQAAFTALLYNALSGSKKVKSEDDLLEERAQVILKQLVEKPLITEIPREELIRQIKQDLGL